MKEKMMRLMTKTLSALLAAVLIMSLPATGAVAANNGAENDPVVVVSLGDSYSSGEGVEKFYGQDKSVEEKVHDENWLAHRSEKSWPGQIVIPGIAGTMKDYNVDFYNSSVCQWYFKASSGATTDHLSAKQKKPYAQYQSLSPLVIGDILLAADKNAKIPAQGDVFEGIGDSVDYVTFTMGGNDVGFADRIFDCVFGSTYLGSKELERQIALVFNNIGDTEKKLTDFYKAVHEKAPNAQIYVAGYPKLLEPNGKGAVISKTEAELVDTSVTRFNNTIKELVKNCYENLDMDIFYVDVEAEFDGHQAFSSQPWLNDLIFPARAQDLKNRAPYSRYSMHPNETGCQHYAACMNRAIADNGTLTGKVCKAEDRSTPISDATIKINRLNSNENVIRAQSNGSGNYKRVLLKGDYSVKISAPGYIPFEAYTTVEPSMTNYMETFLMVQGQPGETGVASGKVTNAMTGSGVADVSLTVREGWNNTTHGDVVTTAATGSDGSYSLTLPIGNYTVYAEKGGYIAASFNIIVQPGTTASQNGTISPIVSGDSFRAVLTWGENPSDLDSHVEGTLTGGGHFHVYYSHKSQYDGDVEVCNLDVDDTTSYGPETTTLNLTTDQPYYYYIYRFAGSGTVASSGAQIKLYQGENLVATFNVPTDQGSGDYWNVFAIVNGELVVRNTITGSADLSYVP